MPHVIEPQYPAAVDRYVDLGRFYDLPAAKAAAAEVKAQTHAYKAAYAPAYRCLNAARQIEADANAAVQAAFDRARAQRRLRGIAARELRRRGGERGRTVRRFLGSITWKGYIWRFDSVTALCPRVYALADSAELAGPLLEELRQTAVGRGWDVIACMAPEEPTRVEHLLIPGLGLAFVTHRPDMAFPGRVDRRVRLDALAEPENKARLRFQRRMAAALREEAVEALQDAKAHHDRLEAVYNPYVDFDGVRALAALESGRLLSWLER